MQISAAGSRVSLVPSRAGGLASTSGPSLTPSCLRNSAKRVSKGRTLLSPSRGQLQLQQAFGAEVSGLMSTLLLGAGAYMLLNQQEAEHRYDNEAQCPRCGGRGVEACMCTKWSDSDVGCGACQNSGQMRCRTCGGGGKAIPAFKPIRMETTSQRPY